MHATTTIIAMHSIQILVRKFNDIYHDCIME